MSQESMHWTKRKLLLHSRKNIYITLKNNKEDSGFAAYILNNIHQQGKIEDIMGKNIFCKKGQLKNIIGNVCLYL
jgi:hypothetical protein